MGCAKILELLFFGCIYIFKYIEIEQYLAKSIDQCTLLLTLVCACVYFLCFSGAVTDDP